MVLVSVPDDCLLPEFLQRGSGSCVQGAFGREFIGFQVPPKPRLKVGGLGCCGSGSCEQGAFVGRDLIDASATGSRCRPSRG